MALARFFKQNHRVLWLFYMWKYPGASEDTG